MFTSRRPNQVKEAKDIAKKAKAAAREVFACACVCVRVRISHADINTYP